MPRKFPRLVHIPIICWHVFDLTPFGKVGVFNFYHWQNISSFLPSLRPTSQYTNVLSLRYSVIIVYDLHHGESRYNPSMTKFDALYQEMLNRIMKEGVTDLNARTGHEVKAVPGMHFSI